ncbi:MAG: trypsin-like peptidase domain-containing protein [Cyclobacteriaceae bacterium]|nr:trypsin-like peptidase domain-containing protein [Cyclobacteriaceae bacterium]MDW8331718.1 trypsin-like peptidase domain-containing protein [Cyclobacteriaceae bacterium]
MHRFYRLFLSIVLVTGGGVAGALFAIYYLKDNEPVQSITQRQQLALTNYSYDTLGNFNLQRFRPASRRVAQAVVHIRVSYGPGLFSLNPLEYRYQSPMRSSGSGVILTDNGYIVTNNHVIEDASRIEVVLHNNARYHAKIIGTDPSTDLALLKIKADNLPFVPFGDSDKLEPGDWVLAVGNPFELTSTVTAGIVSAKARNIGVLRDRNNLQVESFIQTDAAVNPGNSGGALVNMYGELVGINTAIATSTGHYAGYSFAIPVSLVRKVVDDLRVFGQVQRGLLGVQIESVDGVLAEELGLPVNRGVLVRRVNANSAAAMAGIQEGDVITEVAGTEVGSVSELQERVARYRPGEEITVAWLRNGEVKRARLRLRNLQGSEALEKRPLPDTMSGVTLTEVPHDLRIRLSILGGVQAYPSAGAWTDAGIPPGFIIMFVDKVAVEDREDFLRIMQYKKGGVLLEGFTPDGQRKVYALDISLK